MSASPTGAPAAEASGLDLDAIEARANAATPGPWDAGDKAASAYVYCDDSLGSAVAQCRLMTAISHRDCESNADFIAHARTDIPALVAEVRRLRAASAPPPAAGPDPIELAAFALFCERNDHLTYAEAAVQWRDNALPLVGHVFLDDAAACAAALAAPSSAAQEEGS